MSRLFTTGNHSGHPHVRLLAITCAVLILTTTCAPTFAATPVELFAPVLTTQPNAAATTPDQALAASAIPSYLTNESKLDVKESGQLKLPTELVTAGLLLIPLDKTLARAFPRSDDPDHAGAATEFVNNFGDITFLLPVIGGVYLTGDRSTAGEAVTALVNAGIITEGIKRTTGRVRPRDSADEGQFHGPGSPKMYQSFPSGHTSAAFAVATVLANKHPKQKWLYYGLASAVGFARIRKSAHFPSDVLVGAGIGIYAGDNAVNHRTGLLTIKF